MRSQIPTNRQLSHDYGMKFEIFRRNNRKTHNYHISVLLCIDVDLYNGQTSSKVLWWKYLAYYL